MEGDNNVVPKGKNMRDCIECGRPIQWSEISFKYVMNVHVRAQGQIEKEVLCILLYYARNILATFPLKSEALRN